MRAWGADDGSKPANFRRFSVPPMRAWSGQQNLHNCRGFAGPAHAGELLDGHNRYRHWKVLGYKSKAEMLQAEGLSARLRSIRRRIKQLEGKTINAADGPVASNRDVVTVRSEAGGGNAADYLTARLKRDHDAIFQRLAAGGFTSVRQAAIAAGIVVTSVVGLEPHH